MSNKKKAKRNIPPIQPRQRTIILKEENKKDVAEYLGYSMATVDDILAKAKAEGYSGVELPIVDH